MEHWGCAHSVLHYFKALFIAGFPECPNNWKKFHEKCYRFSGQRATWYVARHKCQKLGADLVVIDNRQEEVSPDSLIWELEMPRLPDKKLLFLLITVWGQTPWALRVQKYRSSKVCLSLQALIWLQGGCGAPRMSISHHEMVEFWSVSLQPSSCRPYFWIPPQGHLTACIQHRELGNEKGINL